MGFPVGGTKSRCNLLYGDWTTIGWRRRRRLLLQPRILRRCRCSTVGNCRSERHSLWSAVRAKRWIVSNRSMSHRKWPRALRRRDPWGNAIASLGLSISSLYLSLSLCDVSTANEFLVQVPMGIRRSIAPAARQILDFDITGLIDEYDTNRSCRIGDFVWLHCPQYFERHSATHVTLHFHM